jgi:hypothetical protein
MLPPDANPRVYYTFGISGDIATFESPEGDITGQRWSENSYSFSQSLRVGLHFLSPIVSLDLVDVPLPSQMTLVISEAGEPSVREQLVCE